jgi:hypothetical protein
MARTKGYFYEVITIFLYPNRKPRHAIFGQVGAWLTYF